MSKPWSINYPLSEFATKVIRTYLSFPEDQPYTALDWVAGDGRFLKSITRNEENCFLYGVDQYEHNCRYMRETGFHKVSQADFRSEARITNNAFSLMVVNPMIDERLINQVFDQMDPYNMPNFEEEIRAKVLQEEEERERLQAEIKDQIDFGELTEDNQQNEQLETLEERQAKIQEKIRKELEKRVKAWRMAMKEQQKKMASMRWDAMLLQRATTYLRPGGILVMITPKEFIDDMVSFKLVNQYEDIRIVRLDDEEYKDYRKCVIFAKKRMTPTREEYELGKMLARTKEKPYKTFGKIRKIEVDENHERYARQVFREKLDGMYSVLSPQAEPLYIVPPSNPEDIDIFRVGPVTGPEALNILHKSKLLSAFQEKYTQVFNNEQPVTPTPLHKGHIMLLLTSGVLNGYIGTGPDQHLVKGTAIKDIREFSETDEDGNIKIIEREFYNIGVKILKANGEFKQIM